MKPCPGMRDVQKIECLLLSTQAYFYKEFFFYRENSKSLISESLLKMSPHGRQIISYTSRIYTMQYAYHICNGIGPTVISISMFWAFHMSHKDLR